jgi:uncharacterized delta-60 repeat protein
MIKIKLLLAIFLISVLNLNAQVAVPLWIAIHQGYGDNSDRFNKIISTNDGNFVAVGYSVKKGNYKDFLTIKLDASGNAIWTATKNGKGNFNDEAITVGVDGSGNIYVAGYSDNGNTEDDILLVKYDANGVQQWDTTWNSGFSLDDVPVAMKVDQGGNCFIGGNAEPDLVTGSNDFITLKFNSSGDLQWASTFSRVGISNGKDELAAIGIDSNGDVYVTGRSSNGTDDDYVTIKYNGSNGSQIWMNPYNSGNGDDRATALVIDNGGNVIVTGRSESASAGDDFRTIKYNSAGLLQFNKFYNYVENDRATAITVDASDNVYVAGQSDFDGSAITNYDFSVVKYNSAGTPQWSKVTGSPVGYDIPADIAVDANLNVILTGKSDIDPSALVTNNEFMTVMYNSAGVLQWTKFHAGSLTGGSDLAASIVNTGSDSYIAGRTENNGTQKDAALIKYDVAGNVVWDKNYNEDGDFSDVGKAIILDANDNSYAAGYSFYDDHNRDALIVKVDNNANVLCSYLYNGTQSDDDEFVAIGIAPNGYIFAAGYTKAIDQKSNFLLMKWDPAVCDTEWVRTYDHIGQADRIESMVLDAAGNVYITGRSDANPADTIDNNDIVTIKYDNNGTVQWMQRFDGPVSGRDEPAKILIDNNGDVVVGGRSEGVHDDEFIVIKYNSGSGTPVWANPATWGSIFTNDDKMLDMTIDVSGNIYVCGFAQEGSQPSADEAAVVMFDQNGALQHSSMYGTPGDNDRAISIAHDNNGFVYVTYQTDVDPGTMTANYDIHTMKFDNQLLPVWGAVQQFNGQVNQDDIPVRMIISPAGDIYITGTTENDTIAGTTNQNWITLRYNNSGQLTMTGNYDGPNATDDAAYDQIIKGSSLWVTGYGEGLNNSQKDLTVIKYDVNVGVKEINNYVSSGVHPNPFSQNAVLTVSANKFNNVVLEIYDIPGNLILTTTINNGSYHLSSEKLSAGMYLYKLVSSGDVISNGKFIKN